MQPLIALDQLANTFWKIEGDANNGWGYADEMISARAYRAYRENLISDLPMRVINTVFFWQKEHCFGAFITEFERKQLPRYYSLQ